MWQMQLIFGMINVGGPECRTHKSMGQSHTEGGEAAVKGEKKSLL